jgi:STE24 endopeptidase
LNRSPSPSFNQYEPLAKNHAALVADLEKVVARTGTNIPPDRMYLMKASEKSNGINAYVSGIGATKRIVVWDTTADRIPNDEIMMVFAHESGHYVLEPHPQGHCHLSRRILLRLLALRPGRRMASAAPRRKLGHRKS